MCPHVNVSTPVPAPWCVGTCQHVSAPFQVLAFASTSQYPSKVHMTDFTGVGMCRHLQVSARVGTFSGVGTFEMLTHVSTSQLPNNIHMSARVVVVVVLHIPGLARWLTPGRSSCGSTLFYYHFFFIIHYLFILFFCFFFLLLSLLLLLLLFLPASSPSSFSSFFFLFFLG